jgi:hypothetical protein
MINTTADIISFLLVLRLSRYYLPKYWDEAIHYHKVRALLSLNYDEAKL